MRNAADKQALKSKKAFVDDLILPKQTTAVREGQMVRTTEEGLLRSKKIALSPKEEAISKTVAAIPEVSAKRSMTYNHNAINKELVKEAETLSATLAKNDVAISRKELLDSGKEALKRLKENPLITGDSEKVAIKIMKKMDDLVKKNEPTASGLLKARKELDAWVKSQKSGVFDAKNESAVSIALREVRESANDLVAKKVPNIGVKESLRKQSNLYRALDNVGAKAAQEANNALSRTWQNFTRILPFRGEFNQSLAVVFGIGGLGAAAAFAPYFTKLAAAGAFIYAGGKFVLSPQMKKAVAMILESTDKALKVATDNAMISQLRADRALIIEALKSTQEE